jgi:hypothetical protein
MRGGRRYSLSREGAKRTSTPGKLLLDLATRAIYYPVLAYSTR